MPYKYLATIIILSTGLIACGDKNDPTSKHNNSSTNLITAEMSDIQKLSYIFGVNLGKNIKKSRQSDTVLKDLDLDALIMGLRDSANNKALKLTDQDFKKVLANYQVFKAKKTLEAGKKYLLSKKNEDNIITHKSGILYKIIKKGTGKSPTINDKVFVHYRGRKINGQEFDSSYRAGKPLVFNLSGMIDAWKIALPLMKEGARWTIYAPYSLAYKEKGNLPRIKPYEVLIFDIELLKVNPTATNKKPIK